MSVPPGDRRPTDTPVGQSIILPPGPLGAELGRGLRAIDRVHSDGALRRIVVAPEPLLADESSYEWADELGIVLGIAIRPDARHPGFLLLHEIGHFLDHQGIGEVGSFASLIDERFAGWRSEVLASDAVEHLRFIEQQSTRHLVREHARYLLRIEELWARSYAQFIVIASRDPVLRGDLLQHQPRSDRPRSIPVQWRDDDFLPIAVSILDLLRNLGRIT